jgi:hypothetical protein
MTDPLPDRDLQALWQSQSPRENAISLDEIRERARHLERRVARRNRREYVAAAFVVSFYGWVMWVAPAATIRIGAGLAVAAAISIAYYLHRRGTATSLPADLGLRSALEFHRAQLERQRDLLRSVWWWGLLPFAPSLLVLEIGQALAQPERISRIIAFSVGIIVFMVALYELNRRAAAGIQRRIDRLKESQ